MNHRSSYIRSTYNADNGTTYEEIFSYDIVTTIILKKSANEVDVYPGTTLPSTGKNAKSNEIARRDIFAVRPWFLPSLFPPFSPPPPLSAEQGPMLPLPRPRLPLGSLTYLVNHLLAKLN